MTLEIVKCLYDLQPDAVRLDIGNEDDELLPVHVACMVKTCPFSIVRFFLSKYPDAASNSGSMDAPTTSRNATVLHLACQRIDVSLEMVQNAC